MRRKTTRSNRASPTAARSEPFLLFSGCERGSLGNSSDDKNPAVKNRRETRSKMFPSVKEASFVMDDRLNDSSLLCPLMKAIWKYNFFARFSNGS
jgi:hypothetical protein